MKILSALRSLILFLLAYYNIYKENLRVKIRTRREKCEIRVEKEYSGQKIFLIALYQSGTLRPDVVDLLKEAKQLGAYVLGVNTLCLSNETEIEQYFDCYIERPNFGRDFGSYKVGFNHIYRRNWDKYSERLILLNDSVFFSRIGLKDFLSKLFESEKEVAGATENFEIEHHIGSFCISISNKVLVSQKMKVFWKNYKLSDVRPKVIKHGEIALSKVLRKISGGAENIEVLFNYEFFSKTLEQNCTLQRDIFKLSRTSELTGWKRLNVGLVLSRVEACFSFTTLADYKRKNLNITVDQSVPLATQGSVQVATNEIGVIRDEFLNFLKSAALECFVSGSQIHQNGIILYKMGMPIIKLDLLYRGMFNYEDIRRLLSFMPSDEAERLSKILYSRPFGGDVLSGWKRYAFYRGLI